MSTTGLAIVLVVGVAGLAFVLNHLQARLALIELTLNEGLPPGHQGGATSGASATFQADRALELLGPGVHVFLSRSCHACQRLVEELEGRRLILDADLHLRYVDRPRPIARTVAEDLGAALHVEQLAIVDALGVDPLPHTVAVGRDGLATHRVTPASAQIADAARDAGILADAATAGP